MKVPASWVGARHCIASFRLGNVMDEGFPSPSLFFASAQVSVGRPFCLPFIFLSPSPPPLLSAVPPSSTQIGLVLSAFKAVGLMEMPSADRPRPRPSFLPLSSFLSFSRSVGCRVSPNPSPFASALFCGPQEPSKSESYESIRVHIIYIQYTMQPA